MKHIGASYLERLDKLPPCICWALARTRRGPIPLKTISERTGLGYKSLYRYLASPTWADVPVRHVDALRQACGITPSNEKHHLWHLKRCLTGRVTVGLRHLNGKRVSRVLMQALKNLK